jgi:hypothetical protein
MGRLRCAVEVDVSSVVPLAGRHVVRGTVVASPTPTEPLVWCCLPGGGCTSNYFDLEVEGDETSYSMAAHLADGGDVVLALDHLGTGASSPLEDDFLLTPDMLASAYHAAFSELLGRLGAGTLTPQLPALDHLVPIGLGHSLGAMIVMIQQARHGTYAAVVNLGSMGAGLPEHLRDPQWAAIETGDARWSLVELARVQFGSPPVGAGVPARVGPAVSFHADDVPTAVRAAFAGQQTTLLRTCAMATLLPSFTDPERGAIAVPLFLGFGEHDLSPDAHGSVRRYRSAPDITLFVLAGSGHCHNQAGNRHQLWERLSVWARSLPVGAIRTAGTRPRLSA